MGGVGKQRPARAPAAPGAAGASVSTATAETSAASAAAAVVSRAGLVDVDGPALEFLAVHARDGSLAGLLGRHLDKPEPAGVTGELIADHVG